MSTSKPDASTVIPRPEHPRPHLRRDLWTCLNGEWQFEADRGDSGLERGLAERELTSRILVPFCPESAASGINDVDFLEAVWYRRVFTVPQEWSGRRTLLHFGAVDYDATVWVNGIEVARHRGGFTPFYADLTDIVRAGDQAVVVVRARDSRYGYQPRGKQATWYANTHCQYTRTTGIWQTVWLEAVPMTWLKTVRVVPNVAQTSFTVSATPSANRRGWRLRAVLMRDAGLGDNGQPDHTQIAVTEIRADLDRSPCLTLTVPQQEVRLWGPGSPHLYGLRVELLDDAGAAVDIIYSYAGLRSTSIEGKALRLNGTNVFQRLVLDQGYYPDTIMTAPSDQALVEDIRLAMAAGFNGARLHEKVFEERFFYHADRLGYLVWGEFGDWGVSGAGTIGHNQAPDAAFVAQWVEAVDRDMNHPSIIGWCPLNETHQELHDRITVLDDVTHAMFNATRLADPTRPVIDASGYAHRVRDTDIYDSHTYAQDPAELAEQVSHLAQNKPFVDAPGHTWSLPYAGQPYFVSEYGGIWWNPDAQQLTGTDETQSWGYGQRISSEEEFYERFRGLTEVLLHNPNMFGYCYTQLTDVFQEQNGIYRFDRSAKFDVDRIASIQRQTAAFEEA